MKTVQATLILPREPSTRGFVLTNDTPSTTN